MLIAGLHGVGVELDDTPALTADPYGVDLGGFISSETFADVRMRRFWKRFCY